MVKQHAPVQPPTPPPATEERAQTGAAYDIGRQIGEKLRTMFDTVLTEPVPERFRRLLQDLERASPAAPGAAASGPDAEPPAST